MKIDGPRACTKAELPEVIGLVNACLGRVGTDQNMLTDYPLVYADENLENVRILKVDGELASVVPFIVWPIVLGRCRFSMGIISPTATAPNHRHKGYGLSCVKDCTRKMESMGVELSILRTKVETFPFYEAGDYLAVLPQAWIYPCTRQDAGRFAPHGEEVVVPARLTAEQLTVIRAMHDAQGDSAVRVPGRYPALFSLPKMRTLLAYRQGQLAAYLLFSDAKNMPGLLEAGGDPTAVETLVGRCLAELPEGVTRNAHANLTPSVLGGVMERLMPERRQPTQENRMVRINLPSAFFRNIAPWLEEKNRGAKRDFSVTTAGETVSFHFGPGGLKLGAERLEPHFELTRRQLTAAVFGSHPTYSPAPAPPLPGLPPFYYPVWLLDRS